MLATGLGACSQELDHYETLVLFLILYFVLKMFKNIDFYINARRTRIFSPEQECNLVTVLV